ncbi:hypothetical protein GUJ93_ZPchr0013g36166 [Zizania palustris]|uniref:Bifunctional inhibitor/plant lipid transfer protein/seed storage helical domain-containing protein n=1 Tax=Zizania palustris TaxID=103762 RepID=A0A8J6BXG8_ZIZPA|nr:hypothetical protein GUJ93_ZPchr0013g36166 [Zizania palustris]
MAAYTTKIFALFALLALSASAATAVTTMHYLPPMMVMGTMDPCRQYMMQTLGMDSSTAMFMSQPTAFLRQQCCMQMQLQAMMPQCHCDASCQMMQNMQQVICGGLEHQQMMKMAMDMPYMCNMAHQQMKKKMAMDMPYIAEWSSVRSRGVRLPSLKKPCLVQNRVQYLHAQRRCMRPCSNARSSQRAQLPGHA